MSEFEINACHANKAGQASISLKHVETGALVMIHNMPFDHTLARNEPEQCRRIEQAAIGYAGEAIAFLKTCQGQHLVEPHPEPSAAPNASEAPNEFGQQPAN
ncbi:MAG TPA: hypothetical protein VIO94_01715 [Phenylobacterium sp.]